MSKLAWSSSNYTVGTDQLPFVKVISMVLLQGATPIAAAAGVGCFGLSLAFCLSLKSKVLTFELTSDTV